MSSQPLSCDRELLRRSLDDTLSERQEEELTRHLSECPACQRELERLAAEQAEWSRVVEVLKRESVGRSSGAVSDASGELSHDSPADFAVDFLEPSATPAVLGRLGDIDILEVIGSGGMGIVLKGFQQELHRPVAVKMLAPHLAASGAARKRFAREAQATAVIVHPNVMPVLTVHSSGKLPYLVMPYVPCESLQQRLDREGPLETLDVLRIALQVSRGLAAAHAQGLVHRDIKPANILLEKGVDRVMLTDFGLARAADDASLTRTGVIAGTPQYMSPEQARGESIDARSDLFSLGSVMYAMCTGRPPFRAETSYGILRRITDSEARPIREINPHIPDWLLAIIAKLHAKDPAERWPSAEELAKLLEQCLAHVQQPTAVSLPDEVTTVCSLSGTHQEPSVGTRAARTAVLRRTLIAAVVLAVATLIGVAVLNRLSKDRDSDAPPARQAESPYKKATDDESAAAAWHDGIAEQIRDLGEATDEIEADTSRLWGDRRSAAASKASTNTKERSDQEPTK